MGGVGIEEEFDRSDEKIRKEEKKLEY